MSLFELTRALVDIESTTNHEKNVSDYLFAHLSALVTRHKGHLERIPAVPNRDNIFASWGEPVVTLSTHMDTVPPFFASHEDGDFIWGRGSCDAKGIIAAMIANVRRKRKTGQLLLVSGVIGMLAIALPELLKFPVSCPPSLTSSAWPYLL